MHIAILTDSCTDTPAYLKDKHSIYTVAMHVNYPEASYLDRVTITPEEVYERIETEVPTTSTPSVQEVHEAFERIVAAGHSQVICINVSSGLSGTFSLVEQVSKEFPQLTVETIDTLNIGFGAGFMVKKACDLLDKGLSFEEVVAQTRAAVTQTHTFFLVDTLDYLYKGGRVSKTVHALGSVLNIKPIITCDAIGKYVVAAKARGRKAALKKLSSLIDKVTQGMPFDFAIAHGKTRDDVANLIGSIKSEFPHIKETIDAGSISPVLTVHTGPGLIGVAVQML